MFYCFHLFAIHNYFSLPTFPSKPFHAIFTLCIFTPLTILSRISSYSSMNFPHTSPHLTAGLLTQCLNPILKLNFNVITRPNTTASSNTTYIFNTTYTTYTTSIIYNFYFYSIFIVLNILRVRTFQRLSWPTDFHHATRIMS